MVDDKHTLCKGFPWDRWDIKPNRCENIRSLCVCVCVIVTFGETGVLYSKYLLDDRNDWIPRSFSIIKAVRIRGTARFFLNVLCKTILRLDI